MDSMKLEDCCEILDSQRVPITGSDRTSGDYPYYGANGIQDYVDDFIFDDELVLLAEDGGNFGSKTRPIAYRVSGKCWVNNHAHVLKPKAGLDVDYLCYSLMFYDVGGMVNGATRQKLTQAAMRQMIIPKRSLDEQIEIVNIIKKVQGVIASRKEELEQLDLLIKARFVEKFGDPLKNDKGLPMVSGEALFKLSNGKALPNSKRYTEGIPAYGGNGISWYTDEILCDYDTIIVGRVGFQSGNVHLAKAPLWVTDNAMYISSLNSKECDIRFLCALMEHIDFTRYQDAGDLKKITQKPFMQMHYLMPPISSQGEYIAFVAQVDKSKFAVQKSLDEAQLLFDSLMQEYFG